MERPKIATNISWTSLGENIVVLDTRVGKKFHEIAGVGVDIWNCLEKGFTLEEVNKFITETYDIEYKEAKKDIEEFIEDLKSKQLLQ